MNREKYQVRVIAYNGCWVSLHFRPTFDHRSSEPDITPNLAKPHNLIVSLYFRISEVHLKPQTSGEDFFRELRRVSLGYSAKSILRREENELQVLY